MARRAFVTGATGFIGRYLVDELTRAGWRVSALVRPTSQKTHLQERGAEIIVGDLLDVEALARAMASADTVFHLAAVTAARTESEYRLNNAGGTEAVVRAAATAQPGPRRLVYLSSYAAAGPTTPDRPRDRDQEPAPLTAYGRTKLAGELAMRRAETSGREVVIIRAPVVYGPGDRALLPYFRLVRRWLAPSPGGGDRKLHLVFAPDLAVALRRAADAPAGTYAVAEPVQHRWSEITRTIAAGLGRSPIRLPLPSSIVRGAASVTEAVGARLGRAVPFNREKAEEMLAPAWICDLAGSDVLLPPGDVTPLREGIARTIRWYIRQGWL